jgi:hypothetical protein
MMLLPKLPWNFYGKAAPNSEILIEFHWSDYVSQGRLRDSDSELLRRSAKIGRDIQIHVITIPAPPQLLSFCLSSATLIKTAVPKYFDQDTCTPFPFPLCRVRTSITPILSCPEEYVVALPCTMPTIFVLRDTGTNHHGIIDNSI